MTQNNSNPPSVSITKILSISAIITSFLASGIFITWYENIGFWNAHLSDGWKAIFFDLPQAFLGPLRHLWVFHLLGNLIFLWYFGSQIERHVGTYWYFFGYILSITLIHIAFLMFGTQGVGLSGFAMAILSFLALHLTLLRSRDAWGAWMFLAINVAIGLMASVSLTAHAVGAIAGIIWYGLWRVSSPRWAHTAPPSFFG